MFCCEKDRHTCSLIMESMDGDLHDLMRARCGRSNSPPFTIFEAIDIMLLIGEGVNYLHQKGVIHRDLNSMNILVKSVMAIQSAVEVGYVHAKVNDFGLSKTKMFSTTYSNQTSNTGTPRWMAPEVIPVDGRSQVSTSSQPKHPRKIDVFSFAMLCYEILTADVPFPHERIPRKIKQKIRDGDRPDLPNNCPPELKALIEECWNEMPSKRPSFPTICSKLKYVKYLLMSGLSPNEDPHLTAGEPSQTSTNVRSEEARPKVFISHSVAQKSFVEQLSRDLEAELNYFALFDQQPISLPEGDINPTLILDAAKKCKVAVVVLSKGYLSSRRAMLELVEFVHATRSENMSLRLIPLFYKVLPFDLQHMEMWRREWKKLAKSDSRVDLEEWASCVRALLRFCGLILENFGPSEMKYRTAIVGGFVSYDRICEETWLQMSSSSEQYSEETSCWKLEHECNIFLSYSGAQNPFVEQLDKELELRNHSAFFAKRCLPLGASFPRVIFETTQRCQVAVVVLSENYLSSTWPMVKLGALVRARRSNNWSLRLLPLFYKLSVDDLNDESIRHRWMPKWMKLAADDRRVDLEAWAAAVRELLRFNGLDLEKFGNSEVIYRGAIVEAIIKLLAPVDWLYDTL